MFDSLRAMGRPLTARRRRGRDDDAGCTVWAAEGKLIIARDVDYLPVGRIATRRQHLSGKTNGSVDRGKSRNEDWRWQQLLRESAGGQSTIDQSPRHKLI